MPQPIIEIQGLGKRYRIGKHREPYLSLRDELAKPFRRISSALSRFAPRHSQPTTHDSPPPNPEDFWALRDVSFSVQQGEAVGIIGRNGAGKSTLLKILSQITPPTEGRITCRGRIASLLEVGTGFHPELTGRENIFLNGAILGMTRAEIRRKFDEIVAFAELERFLDTPVKRYSSGMYVRLAFAVAAHLEPELLVVDEVLAVGDIEFQRKCLAKMQCVAQGGRTVLLVSHNMQAIKQLCQRAFLLESGRCIADGTAQDIVTRYLSSGTTSHGGAVVLEDPADRPGDEHVRLCAVRLYNQEGDVADAFESSQPIVVELELDVAILDPDLVLGFDLMKPDGVVVLRSFSNDIQDTVRLRLGHGRYRTAIPAGLLNGGSYEVVPLVSIFRQKWIVRTQLRLSFGVSFTHGLSSFTNYPDRWANGVVAPMLRWRLE
jgi:lipopolysaccharide transport system ATP-binding protein